jgi:hypothetical protein
MAKGHKVPEESVIGPAVYKPGERQCWYCSHNKVSSLCSNCLNRTELFEASKGAFGEYKPAWEYGTQMDKR